MSLFGRTLKKGMSGAPASAYKIKVKRQFGSASFRAQLDSIIDDLYLLAIEYTDSFLDEQSSGSTQRKQRKKRIRASSKPLPLTVELVKQSQELSETTISSILEMMRDEGIYELHPNQLSKRLTDFFNGEKYRAIRFSRTVSADIANNTTLHRYRQRKISRWQFHSKLDERTTDQCRSLHGTIFETDDPSSDKFRPPLHPHCRSAMLPVPLSMEVNEALLYKNRDFSVPVDKNHNLMDTRLETDIKKVMSDINKYKQKYAIDKFILDADIEKRLLKLGVGLGNEPFDISLEQVRKFKRGSEVRAEIPKIRDEIERKISDATREIETLVQKRDKLISEYDALDTEWRMALADGKIDFDTPEYISYMERLKSLRIDIDDADNLFSDALSKRTKLFNESANVTKNAIYINDGEPTEIYTFKGFSSREEHEALYKKLQIPLDRSPYDGLDEAGEFLNKASSSEVRKRLGTIKMEGVEGRAFTRNDGKKIIFIDERYKTSTIMHETGHQIEFSDPRIKKAANDFLSRRTAGEKAVKLKDITGNPNYADYEIAKKDKFMSPYVGKIYSDGDTEVISMGIQYLYEDPDRLIAEDPDLFDLVIDILRGNYD